MIQQLKKINFLYIFIVLLLCLFGIPLQTAKAYNTENFSYIYDDAEILLPSEEVSLSQLLQTVSEKNNIAIYILTVRSKGNLSCDDYIDDFKVKMSSNPQSCNDCVIIMVDMGEQNIGISGYGICENKITNSRAESIIDDMRPSLVARNHCEAFQIATNKVDYYMNRPIFYFQTWFQLLVSSFLALLVVSIMAYHSSGKVTVNSRTYLDTEHSRLNAKRDNYIRTAITKTKKPQNTKSNSGGSGGGSHSHASGHF